MFIFDSYNYEEKPILNVTIQKSYKNRVLPIA